jgi:hypothetical protein
MANFNIVKDPEWQKIRVIILEDWDNPARNVGILRDYLGDFSDATRVRRVTNYLTGFRSDGKGQMEICDLLKDIKIRKVNLQM